MFLLCYFKLITYGVHCRNYYARGYIIHLLQKKHKTILEIGEHLMLSSTTINSSLTWFKLCFDYPIFLRTTISYTVCAKEADAYRSVIELM